jgi:hypothetical protein
MVQGTDCGYHHAINEACSKLWGKRRKTPRFEWKIPLVGASSSIISTAAREFLYKRNLQFIGSFVADAPGYLTENVNPSRGLCNGTPIQYHSMTLDTREDFHRILSFIQDGGIKDYLNNLNMNELIM